MINAFKQIRLTNVNVSGQNGRIIANNSDLAFTSELVAASGVLATTIANNNSSFLTASGVLDTRITNEVSTLNSTISNTSGVLKTYINDQISGVIDMAPEALNTLNELAAALGDDASFASNLTNSLTNINNNISSLSGTLSSNLASTGSNLQNQIDTISGSYVTLGTTQVINGDKTFTGDVVFSGGFEVGDSAAGNATLFVSGSRIGINTEAPAEALDVNGNARVGGSLFVGSGIDANNKVVSNVASPTTSTDAANRGFVDSVSGELSSRLTSTGISLLSSLSDASGVLQSSIDTKVASATQKQFSLLLPTGIETTGVAFPGSAFSSTPTVQVTFEGDVIYQTIVKNRTTTGFDVFFSDIIQENNSYLNVFASNQ